MIKSFKWTGSKRWLVPHIKECDMVVELFAGSGIISFNRSRSCILNDTNVALINLYRAVKADTSKFVSDVIDLDVSIKSSIFPKQTFYDIRKEFNDSGMSDPVAFFVLLTNGFNGLWRCGPNGLNVAYGGSRKLDVESLLTIPKEKILQLSNCSYDRCIIPCVDCLVFADPPYAGTATSYDKKKWTFVDDWLLFDFMHKLNNPFIISMMYNENNVKLAQTFCLSFSVFDVMHTAGQGGKKTGQEMLVFNEPGGRFICE